MKSIQIISIPVTNQDKAKEFYVKIGFQVLMEAAYGEGKWIQLGFPGQDACITLVTWFPNMPAGSLRGFVIKTDSLEQDIEDFTAKGIEVGKIDNTPWGKFLSVKDPDGNAISFREG